MPRFRYSISDEEIIDKHFAKLLRLLREEDKLDHDRFQREFQDKDPEEREKRGKALLWLKITEKHFTPTGQTLLSFAYSNGRPLKRYSLDVGDIVTLSGFKTPKPDQPTGTVYERTRKEITVSFNGRLPSWIGRDDNYHLNISQSRTTYDRMYDAVKTVGRSRHSRPSHIRDLSLGLRKPLMNDPVKPESISFFNPNLNDEQKMAICKAFEAQEILLVHGPPGTGKTSVLIEMILQARKADETVLVSAPSNAACDHLVECLVKLGQPVTRLGHPARLTPKLREHTFSYKLARHKLAKQIDKHQAKLDLLFKQRGRRRERGIQSRQDDRDTFAEIDELKADVKLLRKQIFHQVWHESDIVVATHHGCGDPLIKTKDYDWVILDEATQGIEPSTWIAASRAGKLIMAGDHKQLPPTIFSPKQGKGGLHQTLFERLYEHLSDDSKIRLETQYRMHEKIMKFASQEFYDNQLTAHDQNKEHSLEDLKGVKQSDITKSPVTFLDTAGLGYEEKTDTSSGSRFNEEEAGLVVKQLKVLVDAGLEREQIAVISPYSAQVKLLRTKLLSEDDMDKGFGPEIDSIDAFQGREKEAVIVSLVRSNLKGDIGFLGDTRRMNVAMTRAKRKLIVIGDSATISTLDFYQDFMSYVESADAYASAWEYVS